MQTTEENGILDCFAVCEDELSGCRTYQTMKATANTGDIGRTFLAIPTAFPLPAESEELFVVQEVRSSHAGTVRRILGVHRSRDAAERQAAEAEFAIRGFLERANGAVFGKELCGGTMLEYWHAGNPLGIVGFAVTVETARLGLGSV